MTHWRGEFDRVLLENNRLKEQMQSTNAEMGKKAQTEQTMAAAIATLERQMQDAQSQITTLRNDKAAADDLSARESAR